MRRVVRPTLPVAAQTYLNKRQLGADRDLALGTLDIKRQWEAARKTKPVGTVLDALRKMAGPKERCMYCVDSHGSDIEHFRPKVSNPKRAFLWSNLLLCCTECGRFKGDKFPTDGRRALLVDPSAEDPWQYLDFEPNTGNLTARFDVQTNAWSAKGAKTVEVLQLDRREALGRVYQAAFRRLSRIVDAALAEETIDVLSLRTDLREADDHGLLPWCFGTTGQNIEPFLSFRKHGAAWVDCQRHLG